MTRLLALADLIDRLNGAIGRVLGICALLLVLFQFGLILSVNVFSVGSIPLQESLLYLNSFMFLAGAGYALLSNEHVRVDVFYQGASDLYKARINFFGTLFFLIPITCFLLWIAYPYVAQSWRIAEGSTETSGLPFVYLKKSFILLFASLLLLQGLSLVIRSYEKMRGTH